jgi:hypothetical protein
MDSERTSPTTHRSLAQRLRTLSLAVQVLCLIGAVAAVCMALAPLWQAEYLLTSDYRCGSSSLLSKLSGPPTFETLQRMVLVNVPVLVVQCALLWQLWGLFAEFRAGRLFSDKALQCWQRWGWGVAALAVLQPVERAAMWVAVTLQNPPGQRILSVSLGTEDYPLILLALVFVALARVMREAARAAQENEGFV